MTDSHLISTQEQDFLDQDDPVRGQNYVCVSFISPEDVIASKESYFISAYLDSYIQKNKELLDGLKVMFPDKSDEIRSIEEQYAVQLNSKTIYSDYSAFKTDHEVEISDKYSKENAFQTNIRGIKIRGTYDSLPEAQARAGKLKKMDNHHNIYIAQVGCWCPWAANPDNIESAEYTESQLNTLMGEYMKNQNDKEAFFSDRKNELVERTKLSESKKLENLMEGSDGWQQQKDELDHGEDAPSVVEVSVDEE